VLADEPTAALEQKSGREVMEMIQKLAKERRCTFLIMTHDNQILDIDDRIVYRRQLNRLKSGQSLQKQSEVQIWVRYNSLCWISGYFGDQIKPERENI
jgi:ABC-type lipoprotein export system ATPase subunit